MKNLRFVNQESGHDNPPTPVPRPKVTQLQIDYITVTRNFTQAVVYESGYVTGVIPHPSNVLGCFRTTYHEIHRRHTGERAFKSHWLRQPVRWCPNMSTPSTLGGYRTLVPPHKKETKKQETLLVTSHVPI